LVNGEGFFDSEMKVEVKKEGLNSRLRAKEKMKRAPKGSEDLEAFLLAVQREIFDQRPISLNASTSKTTRTGLIKHLLKTQREIDPKKQADSSPQRSKRHQRDG
jgi:hypothetical protein